MDGNGEKLPGGMLAGGPCRTLDQVQRAGVGTVGQEGAGRKGWIRRSISYILKE